MFVIQDKIVTWYSLKTSLSFDTLLQCFYLSDEHLVMIASCSLPLAYLRLAIS